MNTKDKHFEKKDIQTYLKHMLLKEYILNWGKKLLNASFGKNIKELHFVDGFAGQGFFNDGNDGSPKIAMDNLFALQREFQQKYKSPAKFHIHTIELDESYHNELVNLRKYSPYPNQINNLQGRFEDNLNTILSFTKGFPSLYFIDPFGYKGVYMKDIRRILEQQSHEVLINVMSYSLVRNYTIEKNEMELCKFFGVDVLPRDIAEFISKSSNGEQHYIDNKEHLDKLEERIISLYKKQLTQSNNNETIYTLSKRIYSSLNPFVYFHLVFATKKREGLVEMKRAMTSFERMRDAFQEEYSKQNNITNASYVYDLFSDSIQLITYRFEHFIDTFMVIFNNKSCTYGQIVDFFLQHSPLPFKDPNSEDTIYNYITKFLKNNHYVKCSNYSFAELNKADNLVIESNIPIEVAESYKRRQPTEQISLF